MENLEVLTSLIEQVAKATKTGPGSEQDVTTIISRPMWEEWCKATGMPPDSKPGEWNKSCRVYGSKTVIVESPLPFSLSFRRPTTEA